MNGDRNMNDTTEKHLEEIISFVLEIREGRRTGLKVGKIGQVLFGTLPQAEDVAGTCRQLDEDLLFDLVRRIRFERMNPTVKPVEYPSPCRC